MSSLSELTIKISCFASFIVSICDQLTNEVIKVPVGGEGKTINWAEAAAPFINRIIKLKIGFNQFIQ